MAKSLLVESKKSNLRVSDQFAEVAKIRGSAEENIQRANAQAAQLQANAKIKSVEKWQRATEKLSTLFVNKAVEGRKEAGKQAGIAVVKKAIENNAFAARIDTSKTKENILGFGKSKNHDAEANKQIDAYNALTMVRTINTPYNEANTAAVAPGNRQGLAVELEGKYEGILEELETLGNPELVIQARSLMAEKMDALNNDIAKRESAERVSRMTGDFYRSMASDPHATSVADLKRDEAGENLQNQIIGEAGGTYPLDTITGINARQKRREGAFANISNKKKMDAVTNIMPLINEMADPTTPNIFTPESIKEIEEEVTDMSNEVTQAALDIGVQYTPEEVKQLRIDTLGGLATLAYKQSINLEERGLVAGNIHDTDMVEYIMKEEIDKGEHLILEIAGLISDPVAREEFITKHNNALHSHVKDEKESILTAKAEKDNTREKSLKAVVENSLIPAVGSVRGERSYEELDDNELGNEIVLDFTEALYGDPNGIKPTRGQWGYFISNRINELGFGEGSREAREYRRIGWKRYNSNIAPFSEIAAANGYARAESVVHVQQMDGDKALTDDSGAPLTKPVIISEDGLNNLAKAPAVVIEDASIAILSDPKKTQDAVDVIKARNNALPLNPTSRFAKVAYAIVAGVPFEEGMESVNISKSSNFVKSIAADTGFSLLDAQSYSFVRNLGQRNEKEEATDPNAFINLTGLEKVDLSTAYKDGVFLPLNGNFEPADSDDFNETFGDDFDGVVDLLATDPRRFLSAGVLDENTEAYIKEEIDAFWSSDISIKAIGHANGFQTITYQLFDNANGVILPGEYTIDLRGVQ